LLVDFFSRQKCYNPFGFWTDRMPESTRTILVIDDDRTFLNLVGDFLSSAGFVSLKAESGLDGLKQLDLRSPDLIILDIAMPSMDGMQTCRLIRANEKYREIPILMLTGRGDIKDMIEARKMGADDYLVKPFDEATLIRKVGRLFER
jgi:DNA-binding response OmpR family regulator